MSPNYRTETREAYGEQSRPFETAPLRAEVYPPPMPLERNYNTRDLFSMCAIHPGMIALTLVVDSMLFPFEVGSLGAFFPVSLTAGAVLGFITYKAQMRFAGDDEEAAKIKGLILGFLCAIPSPLPALLYVPTGIAGVIQSFRKRRAS